MSKCLICKNEKESIECIKLKCGHLFCWVCVNDYLKKNINPKIKCPEKLCREYFRDGQIRKVLCEEDIVTYENMCLGKVSKTHKCLLDGCSVSIVYTDTNIQYGCPSCTLFNCISCKAAHMFTNCADFRRMRPLEKNRICQTEIERANRILMQKKGNTMRDMLISLEDVDLIANNKVFECSVCCRAICKGEGVKLRNCSHNICKSCLTSHIASITEIPVKCPESGCESVITDQEIQSVLSPDELNNYLSRCNDFISSRIPNRLHCQTPDCDYFLICSIKPNTFTCDKCKMVNCVKCKTVHINETCHQYQQKLKSDSAYQSMEAQIKAGKFMRCTACSTILEKIKGCNWVQCSKCSLELCWIRQMPRWGPGGRDDISGGCRCGVNGIPCHPKCTQTCIPHTGANVSLDYERHGFLPFFRLLRHTRRAYRSINDDRPPGT